MQGLSFLQGEEGQSRFRGVAEKLPPDEVGHLITCESSSSSPCSPLGVERDHRTGYLAHPFKKSLFDHDISALQAPFL
jgi:hypothetical protein